MVLAKSPRLVQSSNNPKDFTKGVLSPSTKKTLDWFILPLAYSFGRESLFGAKSLYHVFVRAG
jgi:hypothetical protein